MNESTPQAQAPEAPKAPVKRSKTPIIMAVVAILIVVALVAVFFAMPGLSGSSNDNNNSNNYSPKNGDYIEYNVTAVTSLMTLSGTARMDITNVTSQGYDAVFTATGIPGLTTSTTHYNLSDEDHTIVSEYGMKVGTENIPTPWGLRTVDKYIKLDGDTNTTSYIGTELRVPYRMDMAGNGVTVSMVLTSTNIDVIKNANS